MTKLEMIYKARRGDRVTILTPQGQTRTGKVAMTAAFSGHNHLVLDMGGRYGTPGVANEANLVSIKFRSAS